MQVRRRIVEGYAETKQSADDTLKTIAQLQMLLQFKLKNVQELLPCTSMPSLLLPVWILCGIRLLCDGRGKGLCL